MARAACLACAVLLLAAPAPAQVRTIVSAQGATSQGNFGWSSCVVGDVDGDGRADFLVGAIDDGTAGSATIRSGQDGHELRRHDGENANANMGAAVALMGDVDGDGVADYVVSSPNYYDATLLAWTGKIYVYSSASGALIWSKQGFGDSKSWATQIVCVGDADGDGIDDLVLNKVAGGMVQGGRVEFASGADGTMGWVFDAPVKGFWLGINLVGMPDLDGDGVREVAFTSPNDNTGGKLGRVTLLSSRQGVELWSVYGNLNDTFAAWVGDGGDYDGDSIEDVAVGAPTAGQGQRGKVQFFSGVDGAMLGAIEGDWNNAYLGYRFSPAFDADGDGDPDLAISRADSAFVAWLSLYDARSGQRLADLWSGGGFTNYSSFARAGDLDQDGFEDLLVGMREESSTGVAQVFAFRSPPVIASVAPVRGDHHGGAAATMHGSGFALATSLQVTFGGAAATSVTVVDDATITCTTPATTPGPLDVVVSHDAGSATLAGAFAATPATLLDGDDFLGGSFTQRTLCAPNDWLLAVIGPAPEVSIPIAPFEGALAVSPFLVEVIVIGQPTDELDLPFTIPNNPALVGVEVLFQALAGPQLAGPGKSGSWTNCAHLVIH